MHTCEWCSRTREDVEYVLEPYLYEIHDERVYHWMCEDCYDSRKMDV